MPRRAGIASTTPVFAARNTDVALWQIDSLRERDAFVEEHLGRVVSPRHQHVARSQERVPARDERFERFTREEIFARDLDVQVRAHRERMPRRDDCLERLAGRGSHRDPVHDFGRRRVARGHRPGVRFSVGEHDVARAIAELERHDPWTWQSLHARMSYVGAREACGVIELHLDHRLKRTEQALRVESGPSSSASTSASASMLATK